MLADRVDGQGQRYKANAAADERADMDGLCLLGVVEKNGFVGSGSTMDQRAFYCFVPLPERWRLMRDRRRHEWSVSHEILYSSMKMLDRYWDCIVYRMRDLV